MAENPGSISQSKDGSITVVVPSVSEIVHINEIWAFLSVDKKDKTEGVIGMMTPNGWVPFIAADAARLTSLMPQVEDMVRETGMTIRLVKFTNREEVRTIGG